MLFLPKNDPIYSPAATTISIVDEGAGEFLELSQSTGKIQIDPHEWPLLREAINTMIENCNTNNVS